MLAVDPDTTNQRVLQHRFIKYRMFRKPVRLLDKAVSDREGVETMFIDAPGSAKNTLSHKWVDTLRKDGQRFGQRLGFGQERTVETTTVDRLMADGGVPFFVKGPWAKPSYGPDVRNLAKGIVRKIENGAVSPLDLLTQPGVSLKSILGTGSKSAK